MKYLKFSNLKIKYSLLLFIIVATLLISCNDKKPHHENEEPTKEMLAHIIKTEKAVEIYKNYEKERLSILKDTLSSLYGGDFNDTRRVWFDLKTLKNYISYVEKKSKENKITPEGLQFYFSVYGNNEEGDEKNHQTFFIAPTTKQDGKQSGYTLHEVDGETQPLYLKTILGGGRYTPSQNQQMQKAGFFSLTAVQDEVGLLYNDGSSSPPMDNN
ncbi:hypothetical protein UMM65_14230 [Aureibaculum sp. 2210JD6-5]|uniref:hypothetical protein n=1 Tax=Aureibaculum sp. 2210JD6-5 TaxID=3103957 RepID=UPI002AAD2343|nr:hypothetical protein [Aureibaculum sp. 2210JD6-5]MDY7396405.1 hypothetical protein [Aureibaculum sp. 2210JD6-5]